MRIIQKLLFLVASIVLVACAGKPQHPAGASTGTGPGASTGTSPSARSPNSESANPSASSDTQTGGTGKKPGASASPLGQRLYKGLLASATRHPAKPLRLEDLPAERAREEAVAARDRLPRGTSVEWSANQDAWIAPAKVQAGRVVVYIHGGGYALGSVRSHLRIMALVGEASSARVLGVNYSLAPEHPYPAGLNDVLGALRRLRASGVPTKSVSLVADSAGGGLVLATLVALKEAKEPLPAAAALLSPWVDLTGSGGSVTANASRDPVLRWTGVLEVLSRAYRGDIDAADPRVSPLFAQLGGLPPIFIAVGENEILRDDSLRLETKLRAAGVTVELADYPGMWHGWQFQAPRLEEAKDVIARVGRFIDSHS